MKYIGEITDPVHKYIQYTELEKDLIDTPTFQRLRRIKQLAGAHLVYPSAQHSRFEHSLGAMHVAGLAGEHLFSLNVLPNPDSIQEMRVSSLLHDVGHGPFSHLSEEAIKIRTNKDHETIGREIIQQTEINDILNYYGYSSKRISDLSAGQSDSKFMNEIMAGSLSADLMDYLPRDSLFTGAEYGRIDYNRIINSFRVLDGSNIGLHRSALYSFESMLISRYEMFKAVYFHKTVRSAEVMLLHSILLADDSINFSASCLENYLSLTDENILTRILSSNSNPLARQLAKNYLERKLLKCVYEKFIQKKERKKDKLNWNKIKDVSSKIAEIAKVKGDRVFIDVSGISSVPLAPNKQEMRSLLLVGEEDALRTPLSQLPLINSISGHLDMLRVYTDEENRKKVTIAARKVFGDPGS
ncbi:MAG: HD domain-containing protein [Thermoproteota archaeon]|nr:HD domain-containing protein [Thermoproteota archaeon]